jgi:RNA polymerase sigma factor (sigma-70 family)
MSKELDPRDDFDRSSSAIDHERDSADAGFERLRDKLIFYFESKRCDSPEDLAMETLVRLVRRSAEEKAVNDISRYAYGIARNVLHEYWRSARSHTLGEHEYQRFSQSDAGSGSELVGPDEKERRLQCLEKCVQQLPEQSRELLYSYLQGTGSAGRENRRMLAESLGISRETLTLRVFHIRNRMRKCIEKCLEPESEQG